MRLFLDMDGTIARFHDNILDSEGHVQIELMYEPEFFRTLLPFQNMIDGMKLFMKKHPEVEVYSLSAAQLGDPPGFVRQKDEWLNEYLPEIDKSHRIYPECGTAKSGYIPGGVTAVDYLIDDFNKNLREWIRDGGKAIKCKNNINHKGTGKYGGSIGNLWTGDMVSNLDSPEEIVKQLEVFFDLVQEKTFNIYKKEYEEATILFDFVGSFEDEKKKITSYLMNNSSFLNLDSEKAEILLNRIDQVVRSYGNAVREWVSNHNRYAFDAVVEKALTKTALDNAYIDYLNEIGFVKAQIWEHVDAGYYKAEQEKFLLEHVNEIADDFNQRLNEWYSRHSSNKEFSLEVELGCADKAISEMAAKEVLLLTTYPVKDNYPNVEIDISRRDLEKLIHQVFDEGWTLECFLSEYTWDTTEQIKEFLENHPDFCQDFYKITDYADAKYAVIITDCWEHNYVGIPNHTIGGCLYPEKIDDSFVKELLEKGYEGLRILITDLSQPSLENVLFDGVVNDKITERFHKEKKDGLDKMIHEASQESSSNTKNINTEREM